jgi:protein gp37
MAKRIAYMNLKHFDEKGDSWFDDPFQPTFFPGRLFEPAKVKKPSRIFVCSMGDLFGDWVPANWIASVLGEIENVAPWHTYIFLTKNPRRYAAFNPWPPNCWLGVTVTNQTDADERVPLLFQAEVPVRFVSVEPMFTFLDLEPWLGGCVCNGCGKAMPYSDSDHTVLGDIADRFPDLCGNTIELPRLDWLIIGAMTGPGSRAHQPKPEWVQGLIDQARVAGVPLFLKDNLKWPKIIQERDIL